MMTRARRSTAIQDRRLDRAPASSLDRDSLRTAVVSGPSIQMPTPRRRISRSPPCVG